MEEAHLNADLICLFDKLIRHVQEQHHITRDKRHYFRAKQLTRSRNIISNLKYQITMDNLRSVTGIGSGTVSRISEILKTGTLSELSECDEASSVAVSELMKVHGIGTVTAHDLVTSHGVRSIDELRIGVESGKIAVNRSIQIGLQYFTDISKRIPRCQIDEIKQYLTDLLGHDQFDICGSYRRAKPDSGDIDILLKSQSLTRVISLLHEDGFLVADLSLSDKKYLGICQFNGNYHRIDFISVPAESYASALLHFTGSSEFNQKLRTVAISKGLKLSEYGLFETVTGKKFETRTEKDIFSLLDLDFISPKLRS